MNTNPVDWVNLIAAAGSAAAAIFAGVQIYYSRRDANRRATLDFLRQVDERLQAVWSLDTTAVQQQILASYEPSGSSVSAECTKYLALLNTLDTLALARKNGLVDSTIIAEHISTLMKRHLVSLSFLAEFRSACKDQKVYEHLGDLMVTLTNHRLKPEE